MAINKNAQIIFGKMIERGLIPKEGLFEVTSALINTSFEIYREILPPKTGWNPKPSEIRYFKKLSGINLMNLNEVRLEQENQKIEKVTTGSKKLATEVKCGIVYLIGNPAFPGFVKVGMTQDVNKRLSQYQTYDPLKRYRVIDYMFVVDRKAEEKRLLEKWSVDIKNGEWVPEQDVVEMFREIKHSL
jgi:hypothetical protein